MAPVPHSTLEKVRRSGKVKAGRKCRRCEYDLTGLQIGSVCPECGTPVDGRSSRELDTDMIAAKPAFLRRLAAGMIAMMTSLGLGLLSYLAWSSTGAVLWQITGGVALVLWSNGVFLISGRKRTLGDHAAAIAMEGARVRVLAIGTQAMWVVAAGAWFGAEFTLQQAMLKGVTNPPEYRQLIQLAQLCGGVGFVGLLAVCAVLADLASWAGFESARERIRAASIGLTVGLPVAGAAYAVHVSGPMTALKFPLVVVGVLALVGVIASLGTIALTVAQLTGVTFWAMQNAHEALARDARAVERREREAAEMAQRLPQGKAVSPIEPGARPLRGSTIRHER